MNAVVDTGSDRAARCRGQRLPGLVSLGLVLITGLAACQQGDGSRDGGAEAAADYPSLNAVPDVSRPSTPIEERRRIVRDLIDERDRSRRQTALVRARSGLSVHQPPASIGDDLQAEDIIPDMPDSGGDAFRLTPDDEASVDSVYRGESNFEDGGLNDFIRQLKRNTTPALPSDALPPSDDPASILPDEDDLSAIFPMPPAFSRQGSGSRRGSGSGQGAGEDRLIWLAAFAPVVKERPSAEPSVMIRLAAAEEEPGFFCGWLGWVVAWSSMCVDESAEQATVENGDQGGGDDAEQERDQTEGTSGRSAESTPSSSETEPMSGEPRLSEQEAADAIENAGRTALAPVTSSLEKLRDFIEARRSRGATSTTSARTPSLREESRTSTAEAIERPHLPKSRPKRRYDITVVDRGERFDFTRTPLPAFKPSRYSIRKPLPAFKRSPDLPVILPPEDQHRVKVKASAPRDPPPRPRARPNDLLTEGEGEGALEGEPSAGDALEDVEVALALPAEAVVDRAPAKNPPPSLTEPSPPPSEQDPLTLTKAPAATEAPALTPETPAQMSLATPDPEPAALPGEPLGLEPVLIPFEPEEPGLPDGTARRLLDVLEFAKAQNQKIHVIGEAGTSRLARRRATDIGAALVQLGATAEILEYDHETIFGADQVRLVLMSETTDPLSTANPGLVEK